jgi:hypothetical protein
VSTRVTSGGARLFLLAAMISFGVLVFPASSLAAPAAARSRLTGETFSASVDGSSYFVPGTCYSGGEASVSFNFSGTASGPYPGTFTETGTITYALRTVVAGQLISSGPVTGFSAAFSIASPAGTVTGTQRLDPTLAADQDARCYESPGGTSFETDALAPTYTAAVTTSRGTFRDRGTSAATLSSAVALGGSVSDSGLDQSFSSALPAWHRPRSRSWRPSHPRRSRTRRGARTRGGRR